MKLNMKSVSELRQEAGKIVRCTYDTGVSWDKIAHSMALNYLIEQQRANQYAAANAALYDKLIAVTHRTQPVYQDRLRPGDPRADFPGGQPVLKTFSAADDVWGRTAWVNAHEPGCPCFVENPRQGIFCGRGCLQCVCPKLTIKGIDSPKSAMSVALSASLKKAVADATDRAAAANIERRTEELRSLEVTVCSTCEGSGRVPPWFLSNGLVDCPACTPVAAPAAPAAPRLTPYAPTPEERAASEQALRRIVQEVSPGRITD